MNLPQYRHSVMLFASFLGRVLDDGTIRSGLDDLCSIIGERPRGFLDVTDRHAFLLCGAEVVRGWWPVLDGDFHDVLPFEGAADFRGAGTELVSVACCVGDDDVFIVCAVVVGELMQVVVPAAELDVGDLGVLAFDDLACLGVVGVDADVGASSGAGVGPSAVLGQVGVFSGDGELVAGVAVVVAYS